MTRGLWRSQFYQIWQDIMEGTGWRNAKTETWLYGPTAEIIQSMGLYSQGILQVIYLRLNSLEFALGKF